MEERKEKWGNHLWELGPAKVQELQELKDHEI
jgi:hypothetical protein